MEKRVSQPDNVYFIKNLQTPEPLRLDKAPGRPVILVADDNFNTLHSIVEAVDDGKRRIIAVDKASDAMKLLETRAGEIDILITDLRFRRNNPEGIDGNKLISCALAKNPQVKTVMMSGDLSDADLSKVDKPIQKEREGDLSRVNGAEIRHHVRELERQVRLKA